MEVYTAYTECSLFLMHLFRFLYKFVKLRKISRDQQNLPIFKYKDRIIDAVKQNQVIVVAGDTGCGKSTQVTAKQTEYTIIISN